MSEILSYALYLLALALFFALLALIGYIGLSLRRAYEFGRRGDVRYRGSLAVGTVGLLVLGGVGFGVTRLDGRPIVLIVYGAITLAILLVGWAGRLIVPESMGDE